MLSSIDCLSDDVESCDGNIETVPAFIDYSFGNTQCRYNWLDDCSANNILRMACSVGNIAAAAAECWISTDTAAPDFPAALKASGTGYTDSYWK